MSKDNLSKIIIILCSTIIILLLVIIGLLINDKFISKDIKKSSKETQEKTEEIVEKDQYEVSYEDDEYTVGNVSNKRQIIKLKNKENQNAAQKIEETVMIHLNELWKEANKAADDNKEIEEKVGIELKTTLVCQNEKFVTFRIDQTGSMGGVGWDQISSFSYDASTGDELKFADILKNTEEAEKFIYDELVKSIEQHYQEDQLFTDDGNEWKEKLKEEMLKDGNWSLTEQGLEFNFPKYTLGPGATGIISSTIRFSSLANYLNDNYIIN